MDIKDWGLNGQLGIDIWNNKYKQGDETFDEWLDRVSNGDEELKQLIIDKKFLFGGRILANRGLHKLGKKVTYSNCYVLDTNDSIEDIYKSCSDLARTFSYGGGVGVDISTLRPKGAKVNNSARITTGACSFMDTFSQVTETIGQNGRRGALMLSMDINHPDIEEFVDIKTDLDRVTKANISVRVNDEFMQKVLNDETHICKFTIEPSGEVITKEVNARKLFMRLCENNWNYAEPGILYWSRIEDYNILSEDKEFKYGGVNPCAEEPLPVGGSCLLGSFNLNAYIRDKKFDLEQFKHDIHIVVKAMNDVLDEGLPLHPLQVQRDTVRDYRQIGIGIMGIADMLINMEIKYGSEESINLCDVIGFTLANESLKASSLLAKEEGAYPKFKVEEIMQSEFIQKNTTEVTRSLINTYGLRNSQVLTIAPTGSISTMLGISGGIEPIFANSYTRKTESLHGDTVFYKVYTPIVDKYMKEHGLTEEEELPDFFVTSATLNPLERVEMQGIWQDHIDASISSTVNLPYEATVEDVYDIYVEAWKRGLKGITIYRSGCKREGVLTLGNEQKEETKELKRGEWEEKPDGLIEVTRKLKSGCGKMMLHICIVPHEQRIFDVYVTNSSRGGCALNIQNLAITISNALRMGSNLQSLKKSFEGTGSCPSYAIARAKGKEVSKGNSCGTSILYALLEVEEDLKNNSLVELQKLGYYNVDGKEIQNEIKNKNKKDNKDDMTEQEKIDNGYCPECGDKLVSTGGCKSCQSCAWSKCE